MSVENDVDLKQWVADWQAAPYDVESAEQIRHYVARRSGLFWSFAVADFVVGGIALPVLVYFGVLSRSEVERFAMLSLASITVAAVMFGWWNRRGVLRASATTIADYLAISAERLRRMQMAWRVAWLILAAEVIILSFWIWDRVQWSTPPMSVGYQRFAWGWLAGFTALAVVTLVKFGGWLTRDAERFETLKRELHANDS